MKAVLYATDFSQNAEKALISAISMAQANHAQLILLHVFELPLEWDYPRLRDTPGMGDELKDKLEQLFNKHMEKQIKKQK